MGLSRMPNRMSSLQEEMRKRSVALTADPKMAEMRHFVNSHEHDERLIDKADLRKEAREVSHDVDVLRKVEAAEDGQDMLCRSMDLVEARLEWRQQMDKDMRRLMQDTALPIADNQRMQEASRHELRCAQTDKMFDWYEKHGMKQARKEKVPPSFIRFDTNGPVMPGSLRKSPVPAPALMLSRPASVSTARSSSCTSSGRSSPMPTSQNRSSSLGRVMLSSDVRPSSPALLSAGVSSLALRSPAGASANQERRSPSQAKRWNYF